MPMIYKFGVRRITGAMMRSADGIRYNVLVPKIFDKALLEESIMLGQLAEEGGEGEQSLITLRATRPRE
jgi:hypothetical protein